MNEGGQTTNLENTHAALKASRYAPLTVLPEQFCYAVRALKVCQRIYQRVCLRLKQTSVGKNIYKAHNMQNVFCIGQTEVSLINTFNINTRKLPDAKR